MKKSKNTGSTFDDFLKSEDLADEVDKRIKLKEKKSILKAAKSVLRRHEKTLKKLK